MLVSVLMTSYNYERYLSEAIESVLNQTFKDLELIIVDDYSADTSIKIIEEYKRKDSRIRSLYHDRNMGISKTANDGLKMARGKFVSFIGADDVWFPSKLEKQLNLLKDDDNKIVWSEGVIIDGKGAETGRTMTQLLNPPSKKSGNLFQELLTEDFIFGQSLLFKTAYLENLGFNERFKYVNDHLLLVNLSRKYEFAFIPEPLAKYRIHGSNITLKNEEIWLRERILIRNYFLENYSGEISTRAKADIFFKIGYSLSRLGQKEAAKQYYFKAMNVDHFHSNFALYLIYALTGGEGRMGKFLSKTYHKTNSLVS
jgi:glycosyltransferase involved in cell wall biosynthesis